MILPPFLTSVLNDTGKLFNAKRAVELLGLVTALAIGFFGKDWGTAAGVATGALAVNSAISVAQKKAGN